VGGWVGGEGVFQVSKLYSVSVMCIETWDNFTRCLRFVI
jgi:hypothetical protein